MTDLRKKEAQRTKKAIAAKKGDKTPSEKRSANLRKKLRNRK
jgi:hypothetical protein